MILRPGDFHYPDSVARLYPENPAGPWTLEIGFGDGRFWADQGLREPGTNYLGVELSGVSLLKARRRLLSAGLAGTHLTKMSAAALLRGVIPPGALSRIVVNFPDPWPKASHLEHRLLRRGFFELAASRLGEGGEVWFTTDHAEYFAFALAQAQASDCFGASFPEAPPAALRTKYALKWRELGLSAHHVRWRVTRHPDVPDLSVTSGEHSGEFVPHAVLKLPANFDLAALDLANFQKTVVQSPAHTVVLQDAYSSPRQGGWVFLAHVEEEALTQEVLIGVTPRADGTALVRLSRFGGPVVTPGVKAAVGAVTGVLEARGATVGSRAY